MIDLRSDTVTKPTKEMLEVMFQAKVGDDVFNEDPSIINLENKAAKMFGKDSAIFCPSGTMTNQIAIRIHTKPGDEVICDQLSHIYNYEGGGISANAGASIKLLKGEQGRFSAKDVESSINPDDIHFPISRLVGIENTCNKGGGSIWDIHEIEKIRKVCDVYNLKLHLDGARLFNALVETNENPTQFGNLFDTISICLSKGLGCPVGSLLIGNNSDIIQAKRVRKLFGGGMRQAGYLAAAGVYALENHIERISEDHKRAKQIGVILSEQPFVEKLYPIETNIVLFELSNNFNSLEFIESLKNKGILCVSMGKQLIRFVTHLDFTDNQLEQFEKVLKTFSQF